MKDCILLSGLLSSQRCLDYQPRPETKQRKNIYRALKCDRENRFDADAPMRDACRMTEPLKATAGPFELTKVRLEVRGDKLYIWPNKKHPGSPVIVDAAKLDRWASRLYRDGVLQ
jgi:hypothetical protein